MSNWSDLRKFIIAEDGDLRYGGFCNTDPYLHKDLLHKGESTCYGGGFMSVNNELKQVRFSGNSMDYGAPQWDKWTQSMMLDNDYEYFYAPAIDAPYEKLDVSNVDFW
jgi:hypothetical protein